MNPFGDADDDFIPAPKPVMGLADVARGMGTPYPTTIYLIAGKDTSGPVGILFPSGEFRPTPASTTGKRFLDEDQFLQTWECEVAWDGAQPSPDSIVPIGYEDEAQSKPIYREHSKGLLLGDYQETGELWKAIARGTKMRAGALGFTLGDLDLQQLRDQQQLNEQKAA